MLIYVISATGHPLMPTSRGGRVRHLLNEKKATIVKMKPFAIQLAYETPEITQTLIGGTDPGRTNIGEAVVNLFNTNKCRFIKMGGLVYV